MGNLFYIKNLKYKDILNIKELKIKEKIITCILGESGSGKTTLLKQLNNLLSPSKGEIYYRDIDINDLNPIDLRRQILMLGQTPVTFEGTIKDNFNIALDFSDKINVDDNTLKKYLEIANLDKKLDYDATKMSGGEKQRLALARVLLLDGEVLLLDEPSSSLDEYTERFVIEKIVNYAKENNKSVIMVTHSSDIAKKYGDEIIKLNRGGTING